MAYITPIATPASQRCWRLSIPQDKQILGAVLGQLLELTKEYHWEQTTGISALATAALMQEMFDKFSVGDYCMIGSLIHFVTNSPPSGVLLCDGTQYLREDYPDLYSDLPASLIIDADNFVVPTIEDVFMLASGSSYLPETTGGAETHVLTVAEMPAHNHIYDKPTFNIDVESIGVPDPTGVGNPPVPTATSNTGSDEAHENMPPFIAYKVGIVAR